MDGQDATDRIVDMVGKSDQSDHIKAIMLDGITFGGFNTADIKKINRRSDKPVIAVNRSRPNFEEIEKAADKQAHTEYILKAIENAGKVFEMEHEQSKIYFQCEGIESSDAGELIENSTYESGIPEPLRVAHLIAKGIRKGKSTGGR